MPSQDEIYTYLKYVHPNVKFRTKHLEEIFQCARAIINDKLHKMHKWGKVYPGFTREEQIINGENGRNFVCFVYYVDN